MERADLPTKVGERHPGEALFFAEKEGLQKASFQGEVDVFEWGSNPSGGPGKVEGGKRISLKKRKIRDTLKSLPPAET